MLRYLTIEDSLKLRLSFYPSKMVQVCATWNVIEKEPISSTITDVH